MYTDKSGDFIVDYLFSSVDADELAENDEHIKDWLEQGHNWNVNTTSVNAHFMHVQHATYMGTIGAGNTLSLSPGMYFLHGWSRGASDLEVMYLQNFYGGGQGYGTYSADDTTVGGTALNFPHYGLIFSDGTNIKFKSGFTTYFNCQVFKYNQSK